MLMSSHLILKLSEQNRNAVGSRETPRILWIVSKDTVTMMRILKLHRTMWVKIASLPVAFVEVPLSRQAQVQALHQLNASMNRIGRLTNWDLLARRSKSLFWMDLNSITV
jgi:hypothetical protein